MKEAPTFMILPSMACQASCSYCFGPNRGGMMPLPEAEKTVEWVNQVVPPPLPVRVVFHGGEPLLVGSKWYAGILEKLFSLFGGRLRVSVQSNLWLLDIRFCDLFSRYNVRIGTSLDGPEEINDAQRGTGYFQKTIQGIHLARKYGIEPGVVCTFTPDSASHKEEILDFFSELGLSLNIHFVTDCSKKKTEGKDFPEAFVPDLLTAYNDRLNRLRIDNLDAALIISGGGPARTCTYDCRLGSFFAVSPGGNIYPCNRFAAEEKWTLGSIHTRPTIEDLLTSNAAILFKSLQEKMRSTCSGCSQEHHCRGGCTWQAARTPENRDPECPAHFALFSGLENLGIDTLLSPENLNRVFSDEKPSEALFDTPLLRIRTGREHPSESSAKARRILGAAALGVSGGPEDALLRLGRTGLLTRPDEARRNIEHLFVDLTNPVSGFGNLYLHITNACNLHCTHCYTPAKPVPDHMPVRIIRGLIDEAGLQGFEKIVITGGEPTIHPQFRELLTQMVHPPHPRKCRIVLRSNLFEPFDQDTVSIMDHSIDELRVSLDGNEQDHDKRRGKGSYRRVIENLDNILPKLRRCVVSVSVTTDGSESGIAKAEAVRQTAQQFKIGFRVSPLLPVGRLANTRLDPDPHPFQDREYLPRPASSCGVGAHVSITSDGSAFPCHALAQSRFFLGNVISGLSPILGSEKFQDLRRHTVDTNSRCRICSVRYVCGGICRAWIQIQECLDTPAPDCRKAHERARNAVVRSLELLEIPISTWREAGLPLPDHPPEVI